MNKLSSLFFLFLFLFLFSVLMLQACSSIQKPYSTILQSPPSILKTSVGNIEVWKWEPQTTNENATKGIAYLIPGFPGSSLENAPLAQRLLSKGYSTRLINPPGHGQSPVANKNWNYRFDQYAKALHESIQTPYSQTSHNNILIIAHSAGAEMVLKMLLNQSNESRLPANLNVVFINPWLPSISNHTIPWTDDDKDILKYSHALIKIFGPISKDNSHKRLFSNPKTKKITNYLLAHEKLTEDLNGWGTFDNRFTNLIKATTRTQKNVLDKGKHYELSKADALKLQDAFQQANANILIINSSEKNDKVIPQEYKLKLKNAMSSKFQGVKVKFVEILEGGHMLQVEQPLKVLNALIR